MNDVVLGTGIEVVKAEHIISVSKQAFAEVTTDKAGTTGNQNTHYLPPEDLTAERPSPR